MARGQHKTTANDVLYGQLGERTSDSQNPLSIVTKLSESQQRALSALRTATLIGRQLHDSDYWELQNIYNAIKSNSENAPSQQELERDLKQLVKWGLAASKRGASRSLSNPVDNALKWTITSTGETVVELMAEIQIFGQPRS